MLAGLFVGSNHIQVMTLKSKELFWSLSKEEFSLTVTVSVLVENRHQAMTLTSWCHLTLPLDCASRRLTISLIRRGVGAKVVDKVNNKRFRQVKEAISTRHEPGPGDVQSEQHLRTGLCH